MNIYVVKNERNEEVAAYTDAQHAERVAAEFEQAMVLRHHVETLKCESEDDVEDSPAV